MTLALSSPDLVSDIVAVDNAPADKTLSRDFAEYVRGMKKIEQAAVTRQGDADKILQGFEKVRCDFVASTGLPRVGQG
jgi:hypothetical protein